MRDVIVVGAGGGGPVVAKELAARGLDVLLLEAGARFADPEREWTHFKDDAGHPAGGFLRFGPAERARPAWRRELPQNSALLQVRASAAPPCTTSGTRRGPCPAPSGTMRERTATPTTPPTCSPFATAIWSPITSGSRRRCRCRPPRWAPKRRSSSRRGAAGVAGPDREGHHPGRLPPAGERHPPTRRERRDRRRSADSNYPLAGGCTFCGHCPQGCFLPRGAPRNLKAKRSTDNSYVPMALTADRWTAAARRSRSSPTPSPSASTPTSRAAARSVTWRVGATGELVTEEAHVIVLAAGAVETPRLWLNSGLPNPNDRWGAA